MRQFELLINTGRKGNKEHLRDVVFIPHSCKNISPLGRSLSNRRSLTAHGTTQRRSKRYCRHCPQTSMIRFSRVQHQYRCIFIQSSISLFPTWPPPLQLVLALQAITKRGDNHFKFHIQTAESMEIKCCVLHSSEVLSLLLL